MAAYLVELLLKDSIPTKERYTTMETNNIVDLSSRDGITDALTDMLKTGAQELIASAVEAELAGYMEQFAMARTPSGHAAVVRNGYHPERPIQTGIGPVSIRLNQAHFSTHNLSALISAFPVSISFRMRAVSAIFGAFPDATILSYFVLRSGLNRAATRAGM